MKKFITRTIVLALIAAAFIISFVGSVYLIQSKVSFKLPESKHILVLGDSHTECAVDDNIFSCAENLSQSAEAYLYSYCKMRKFLKENKQVDTVILAFRADPLRSDGGIFLESYMMNRIPQYLLLMEKEDIAIFSEEKTTFVYAALRPEYLFLLNMLRGKPLSYTSLNIGAYSELHRDKLQEDIERRGKNKDTGLVKDSVSDYQKTYILKIAELCRSEGVELILLNSPTYKPEVYENNALANDFRNACLPDVKYMDYSAFPLPDSCYGDIDHLNYRGARIFSRYLQERFSADVKTIGEENCWAYGDE
jgi:hypothetical protein